MVEVGIHSIKNGTLYRKIARVLRLNVSFFQGVLRLSILRELSRCSGSVQCIFWSENIHKKTWEGLYCHIVTLFCNAFNQTSQSQCQYYASLKSFFFKYIASLIGNVTVNRTGTLRPLPRLYTELIYCSFYLILFWFFADFPVIFCCFPDSLHAKRTLQNSCLF